MHVLDVLISGTIGTLVALVPAPPAWVSNGFSALSGLFPYVDSLGVWIPVGLALTIGGAIVAAYVAGVVIKLIRMVVSYLTLGGGAT